MEGKGSLRKQAKFSPRIFFRISRILRSRMPSENPGASEIIITFSILTEVFLE